MEATLPYFINHASCHLVILARRIGADGQDGATFCAFLVLLQKGKVSAIHFARPAAITREGSSANLYVRVLNTNLAARMVPKIGPVDFEATVIPPMNHFMGQRIFQMSLAEYTVRTKQNARLRRGTTGGRRGETARNVWGTRGDK